MKARVAKQIFVAFHSVVFRSAGHGVASRPAPLHSKRRCLRSAGGAKSFYLTRCLARVGTGETGAQNPESIEIRFHACSLVNGSPQHQQVFLYCEYVFTSRPKSWL